MANDSEQLQTRKKLHLIEVGPTALVLPMTLTLTYEPWSWPTHMQKFKVNGQSDPMIEWKRTDGQKDGGDRIISLANAVGKSIDLIRLRYNFPD